MSVVAIEQAQPDPKEILIRGTILWHRKKNTKSFPGNYKGNGHLGVTLEELRTPFNLHFGIPGPDISYTIKAMIEKGTLVLVLRRYENKGGRRSYITRGRRLAHMQLLLDLPKGKARGQLRFYLPDALPKEVAVRYNKTMEAIQVIRETFHCTPTVVA